MNSATGISSPVLLRGGSRGSPGHSRPTAATITRLQIPHSMMAIAQASTVPKAKGVKTMSATRPHCTIRSARTFIGIAGRLVLGMRRESPDQQAPRVADLLRRAPRAHQHDLGVAHDDEIADAHEDRDAVRIDADAIPRPEI